MGDLSAVVERVAHASFVAITNGRRLAEELRGLRRGWEETIRVRRDSGAWRLADVLLRQPVVDAPTVAAELDITPQNARRAITPLVEAGILTEFTGFARNRMWQATAVLAVLAVLDALDAFAARAGWRGGL